MSEPTAELLRAALAETRYDNAGNRLMRQSLYAAIAHDPELVAIFHEETRRPEVTDIVEQAARRLYESGAPFADSKYWAQRLADAGLLREPTRTVPHRDEIAAAIAAGYEPDDPTPNRHDYRAADAVLELMADQPTVNEVKAQALAEAADYWENETHQKVVPTWLRDRAQQIRDGK